MKGKDLIKTLKKDGWELDRINGSHHILIKEGHFPLSVPVHNKDLGKGLLGKLKKQAGLK